jgi:cell wall-associated NlpC family hydrolase
MVAYTESSLENLGPESGNDGSLGLFQQRVAAGWGTASEEQDPTDAAGMFVERLLRVPHWQSLAPWVAAQDVQGSAFNGVPSPSNHGSSAVGANYEANRTPAGAFMAAIAGLAAGADCGGEDGAEPAGPASSFGLPPGYAVPSDATPAEALAISYAISKLGDAYVWGAAGPTTFDCSGLTKMAWAQAGVTLAHFTGDQLREGTPVGGFATTSPGDLVLIPGSDGTLASPGHVGLYIGDGLVLSATEPEVYRSLSCFAAHPSYWLLDAHLSGRTSFASVMSSHPEAEHRMTVAAEGSVGLTAQFAAAILEPRGVDVAIFRAVSK